MPFNNQVLLLVHVLYLLFLTEKLCLSLPLANPIWRGSCWRNRYCLRAFQRSEKKWHTSLLLIPSPRITCNLSDTEICGKQSTYLQQQQQKHSFIFRVVCPTLCWKAIQLKQISNYSTLPVSCEAQFPQF